MDLRRTVTWSAWGEKIYNKSREDRKGLADACAICEQKQNKQVTPELGYC